MKSNLSFMKLKFFILITFVLCSFARINAQTNPQLWGMTTYGGSDSTGIIFHINADGTGMSNIHDFGSFKGNTPYGDLVLASNGKLYGMTSNGGSNNAGVIFSFDTATGTTTALHHFNPVTGGYPYGSLIQASNGKLYGMTNSGGTNNFGVVFSYDYINNIYTDLWDLKASEGEYPYGNLLQASNGLLYGMASNGGADSVGTIFSYNIASDTLIVVQNFDTIANVTGTGGQPHSSLIQAIDGKLYGVARNNGAHGWGTIFRVDPSNNNFTKIFDFSGIDGLYPYGSLIQGTDGLLYGMTQGFLVNPTDGSIYSINPVNFTFQSRYSFYTLHIGNPFGTLRQLSNGLMYGMTYHGVEGVGDSSGVLFSFYPSIDSLAILHQFQSTSGNFSEGSLIFTNGKFYGMTSQGGTNNSGVIFSFDTLGNVYNDLYNFQGANDGFSPYGTLVKAGNGLLYGMTEYGGKYGKGTIFSVDPTNNNYTSLYSFSGGIHGAYPTASFLLASDGKLYGTTQYGGPDPFNSGILFTFDITGDSIIYKDHFPDTAGVPSSALIEATDGNLYGVTSGHGFGDFGQLYGVNLSSGLIFPKLFFVSTSIGYTWGSLLQASNGKLYGLACKGSIYNVGSIFSFDLSNNTWSNVYTFNLSAGGNPFGNLIQANDGNLYGLSQFGGDQGHGSLFRLNPSNDSIKVVHSFNYQFNADGYYPFGSLIQSRNGKLYGMTCFGVSGDSSGMIFNYDIFNHTYTPMLAFNITNGANPTYNNLFELGTGTSCFAYFSVYPVGAHNYKIVNLSTGIQPVTYLWDFGDGNTSTSQYPTHVYAATGDYLVCLTIHDSAGCQNTYCDSVLSADTINIMSPIVAGIPLTSNNQNTLVSLYPNPFTNSCTIKIIGNNFSKLLLKIYDIVGQEVKSVYVGDNKEITLNRDNLPSGMYFYRLIQNKTEVISNGKFVIE